MTDRPAQILVVGTGNTCRSPMLAGALDLALNTGSADASRGHPGRRPVARVRSAGTNVIVGSQLSSVAVAVLRELGWTGDPQRRARSFCAEDVHGADLILVAERSQRAAVVGCSPRALHSIMTIRQAGRVLDLIVAGTRGGGPPMPMRHLVPLMLSLRGHAPRVPPVDDDVFDPIGRSLRAHRRSLDQMMPVVRGMQRMSTGVVEKDRPSRARLATVH